MEEMKAENEAHITEMEEEHKARIVKLETKTLGTPPTESEAWAAELQGCATTIDSRLVDTQQLLDEAMHSWMTMKEIDAPVEVCASL